MLYRSLVVGLLGAIALLIAALPAQLRAREPETRAEPAIVHVSQSALARSPLPFRENLAGVLGLAPDERISHVELTVSDGVQQRRVVVEVQP